MKIASKAVFASVLSRTGFALLLGIVWSAPAMADDNTAANAGSPMSLPMPGESSAPSLSSPQSKSLSPLEDKVTDAARNVVKQLGTVDNVSLDDLNSARLTVVKLEMLIDIEKHLVELDKVREGRTGGKPAVPQISMNSITPQFANAVNPSSPPSMPAFEQMPGGHSGVSRISGADGRFTAVIHGRDVHVGDHLGDGSTVVAINAQQVSTKSRDGALHQLKVNGVDEIFGHTL